MSEWISHVLQRAAQFTSCSTFKLATIYTARGARACGTPLCHPIYSGRQQSKHFDINLTQRQQGHGRQDIEGRSGQRSFGSLCNNTAVTRFKPKKRIIWCVASRPHRTFTTHPTVDSCAGQAPSERPARRSLGETRLRQKTSRGVRVRVF